MKFENYPDAGCKLQVSFSFKILRWLICDSLSNFIQEYVHSYNHCEKKATIEHI